MRTAIIHVEGVTQVILQGENAHEKAALQLLAGHDEPVAVEYKTGAYEDGPPRWGFPDMCQGGYLRGFDSTNCVMLVIRRQAAPQEGT